MASDLFLLNKFARQDMGTAEDTGADDQPEDPMPSLSGASL